MEWSPIQEKALREADRWLRDPSAPPVFRMFGYAGTGKTTLAKHLAADVKGQVLYGAFTGKAASVMRRAGCPDARTIHSLIYAPAGEQSEDHLNRLKEELKQALLVKDPPRGLLQRIAALRRTIEEEQRSVGRPMFTLREMSELTGASLLIVDECSMVDQRMGEDLLSFGVKLLVLGDPAQLPPVNGQGYFTNARPDVLLTEIHRQARDNPIIEMATRVREGRDLPLGSYGSSKVVSKVDAREAVTYSQMLVGRNAKRRSINERMRQLAGRTSQLPQAGERIVCLRNNKDAGLLNGTVWEVMQDATGEVDGPVALTIRPEEGGGAITVPAEGIAFVDEDKVDRFPNANVFTWGYALTVHKAQGSQWPSVLLFDDWSRADSRRQWLYTGITRAQDKLTLVRE
jgi:exodeoxyribonuclease-5